MTDQGLRDALEKLADELDSNNVVMVAGRALRDLLTAHPAEPVGVSDEAVEAAWRTYNTSKSGGGPGGMRAALEAAAPLMGATIRGIRSRDSSNQGMRDALENLASESIPLNGVRWISAREVEKLLAAHPADPAEPVGVCTCPPHANPEYSTPGDWDPNCPVHFPVPAEPVGVSDEAVEAAAKHFQQFILNSPSWEDETKKHLWRECSRAALEAAAPFLQPQVVASLPTQRQLDGWLSDHEKVYHGELGDRCACGWRPDSWESEDEFDEYFRDHRSAAVLALMGGADEQATCAVEHPRGFGRCVFVAGHHYEAGEDWTPHADSRGRSWNSQPPEDSE